MVDRLSSSANSVDCVEFCSHPLVFTPFDAKWIPYSASFVVLGCHQEKKNGCLNVFQLEEGQTKLVAQRQKGSGIKCGTFGASFYESRSLATGDYSGCLSIWDLERLECATFSVQAHTSLVNTIDGVGGLNVGHGAPEIATASRDGFVKIWDPRHRKSVASFNNGSHSQTGSAYDCWAVAFGNSYNDCERCIAAGYDNGDIKLYDLKAGKMRYTIDTTDRSGVICLDFDRKDIKMNKLLATTVDSKFTIFDIRNSSTLDIENRLTQKVQIEENQHVPIWAGQHLPQNREIFMTCGGDGTVGIYRYQRKKKSHSKDKNSPLVGHIKRLRRCKLGESPILSVDFSTDKKGLCLMTEYNQIVKVCMVTSIDKY